MDPDDFHGVLVMQSEIFGFIDWIFNCSYNIWLTVINTIGDFGVVLLTVVVVFPILRKILSMILTHSRTIV